MSHDSFVDGGPRNIPVDAVFASVECWLEDAEEEEEQGAVRGVEVGASLAGVGGKKFVDTHGTDLGGTVVG
jgi:hypothetical protein